jgi:hypothetical protein
MLFAIAERTERSARRHSPAPALEDPGKRHQGRRVGGRSIELVQHDLELLAVDRPLGERGVGDAFEGEGAEELDVVLDPSVARPAGWTTLTLTGASPDRLSSPGNRGPITGSKPRARAVSL